MVWYDILLLLLLLLLLSLLRRSARAGVKNCQTRSPWAERKGAVGRRYAGWAGADNDGGGGGCGHLAGAEGDVRRCGMDHLLEIPWNPPPLREGGRNAL